MNDLQAWFLQLQEQLFARVGEPVLLTVRMAYDEWFEVEVSTFSDRWGTAVGSDVAQVIEDAVQMLLDMDLVVAEIQEQAR